MFVMQQLAHNICEIKALRCNDGDHPVITHESHHHYFGASKLIDGRYCIIEQM